MKNRTVKLMSLMMSGMLVFLQAGAMKALAAPEDEDFGDLLQEKFEDEEEEEEKELSFETDLVEKDIENNRADGNIISQGAYGGIKWTLNDEGTLIISGKGCGSYYEENIMPSLAYHYLELSDKEMIKKVIIEEGVTGIASGLFTNCDQLTEISIPDSVTFIEDNAFYGCSSLTSLTVPETVTYISNVSEYIKDIYYGGSQEEWESIERYGDFSGVSMHYARKAGDYKKVSAPVDDSVVSYGYCGKNVYWTMDKDGCLTIGGSGRMNDYSYRFDRFNSTDIKRVVIKEGVTHIGAFSFSKSGYDYNESAHYFMSSWLGYKIDYEPLNALKEISIPSTVTSIGDGAFARSTGITDIYYNGTQQEWNSIAMTREGDRNQGDWENTRFKELSFDYDPEENDITFHFVQYRDGTSNIPVLIVDEKGKQTVYVNDEPVTDYNGLAMFHSGDADVFVYIEKGKRNENYSGYVEYNDAMFYVAGGTMASELSGLIQDPNHPDDWYFLSGGQAQTQYTGLTQYDGEWFYVENGKLNTKLADFVPYDGGLFYVGAGRIMREVNGLAQDPDGTDWYYLAEGQAQTQYTGLALYDGEWFYVIKGKLATDYTGQVSYNGGTFDVVSGMVQQ